jgi:hypothetical protein
MKPRNEKTKVTGESESLLGFSEKARNLENEYSTYEIQDKINEALIRSCQSVFAALEYWAVLKLHSLSKNEAKSARP